MENSEKKAQLKKQIADLRSGNKGVIISAIKEVRQDSDPSILHELFSLLLEREEEELISEISQLLCDLKNQEAAGILAGALEKDEYRPIARILASACWQNGLSYGKYSSTFVNLALDADFETAFEAITVLEESAHELEDSDRKEIIAKLKLGILEVDPQKQALIHNLIHSIST